PEGQPVLFLGINVCIRRLFHNLFHDRVSPCVVSAQVNARWERRFRPFHRPDMESRSISPGRGNRSRNKNMRKNKELGARGANPEGREALQAYSKGDSELRRLPE